MTPIRPLPAALATAFAWCLTAGVAKTAPTKNDVSPPSPPMTIYIGSYSKNPFAGLSVAQFNAETGEISAPQIAAATPNPSFLALHPAGDRLLVANESGEVAGEKAGGVSVFAIDADHGLTLQSAAALPGGPCHIAVDATGKFAVAATYGAGTTAAYEIPAAGQKALPRIALVQHQGSGPNAGRQKGPHAHQAVFSPNNKWVLVADLGTDKLTAYRFADDGNSLIPHPPSIPLPPGSGPRHLAFTPDAKYLYVAGELDNTVTAFRYDEESGGAALLQTLSTLPPSFSAGSVAEIAVHPNGRLLYISNRGHDSIAGFAIGADGHLAPLGHTPTGGRTPRHFVLDPSGRWMLVANADSGSITVFKIDAQSGDLTLASVREGIEGQPVCVLFGPTQGAASKE